MNKNNLNLDIRINIEELKKLPHACCEDLQNRIFPLHPLLDENGVWHLWVPTGDGKLTEIKGTPVESNYFAKNKDHSEDIIFPFLEFLNKRALWPEIYPIMDAITNDVHNLSSSVEKIKILEQENKSYGKDIRRMVGTELEYIFITCRGLFDLLQKIISRLWKKVEIKNKIDIPPERFKKMVIKNENEIIPAVDIVNKYNLPLELAEFYNFNAPFFQWLRDYRDKIIHRGGEFSFIFVTDSGLSIFRNESPFKDMPIWSEKNTLPNNMGSISSVISYLIFRTLNAFEDAISFFQKRIIFPKDVVPNYRMYTRGIYNKNLVDLKNKISNPF